MNNPLITYIMQNKQVYFRKITKSMIIVTDSPLETVACSIEGMAFKTRTQKQVTFGILCLVDAETGLPVREDHQDFKRLASKLLAKGPGTPIPGFRFSTAPVKDKEGKPTGMLWVEADEVFEDSITPPEPKAKKAKSAE
jgi:hypothetical protein